MVEPTVPEQIRQRLTAIAAEAEPQMHALDQGFYPSYAAAGKLALTPRLVLVGCARHQTNHLYERQQWQRWLDIEELSLLSWLATLPGATPETARKRELAARFGIKQIRLNQVRQELAFYAWQRKQMPPPAKERPYNMRPDEYAKLTKVKLGEDDEVLVRGPVVTHRLPG